MALEVDKQIVITGIVCLAGIYLGLILSGQNDQLLGAAVIGAISLAIGVTIPAPKVDNKRGVLIW